MLPINVYPYLDITDLNLDMILKSIKSLSEKLNNFVALNTIKYANPIQWNITTQYEMNTVVIDPVSGTAYLSVTPVPSGVALSNTDYWTPIFTLNLLSANQNITLRDDANNVISTFESNEGDWLIWNYTLYKVTRHIGLGQAYVVGYNLERYTVELFIKDYINAINTIIGDLDDLTTADKDSIVDAINEVNGKINSLFIPYVTPEQYGAIGDGITDDTQAIIDMINDAEENTMFFFSSKDGYYLTSNIPVNNKKALTFYNGRFILDHDAVGSWFELKNCENIRFDKCYFGDIQAQIIRIYTAKDIFINECTFDNCGYCIIQETGYISNNVNITNCRFYDVLETPIECNCGVGYDSDNWIITGNIMENPENQSGTSEHCFVTVTACHNVIISNNVAINARGNATIMLERVSDKIIVNSNVFVNCAGDAFIMLQSQGKKTIISNNRVVQNYNTNTVFLYSGLASDQLNVKMVITGNHYTGNGNAPLFYISNGNPSDPKTYSPILITNNLFEEFENIFIHGSLTEMIKAVGNVFKATATCFDYSASSTYPGQNIKNMSFSENRFIGNVILAGNYYGSRPERIHFNNNEIHGNVDIKQCNSMYFNGNVLYDDSTYSFTPGTNTVAANNYKYGAGAI